MRHKIHHRPRGLGMRSSIFLALVACNAPHGGASLDGAGEQAGSNQPDGPSIDAAPCGMRSGMRGMTNRTAQVAGLHRTYAIYLPSAVDPAKPLPLVFVFHGYTMSGQEMSDLTQYSTLADSEGIA